MPVVVTTAVQLFESLLAARTARCRKLRNLARAVVVLDEAQTLPPPLLRPLVAALQELTRNSRVSVALCTAGPQDCTAEATLGRIAAMNRPLASDLCRLQHYTVPISWRLRSARLAAGVVWPVHASLPEVLRLDDLAHYRNGPDWIFPSHRFDRRRPA